MKSSQSSKLLGNMPVLGGLRAGREASERCGCSSGNKAASAQCIWSMRGTHGVVERHHGADGGQHDSGARKHGSGAGRPVDSSRLWVGRNPVADVFGRKGLFPEGSSLQKRKKTEVRSPKISEWHEEYSTRPRTSDLPRRPFFGQAACDFVNLGSELSLNTARRECSRAARLCWAPALRFTSPTLGYRTTWFLGLADAACGMARAPPPSGHTPRRRRAEARMQGARPINSSKQDPRGSSSPFANFMRTL